LDILSKDGTYYILHYQKNQCFAQAVDSFFSIGNNHRNQACKGEQKGYAKYRAVNSTG
jgi:hypothetical protein